MIREEIKQLKTEPRDLRKFGLMVGGVFSLLGLWFLYRHKAHYPYFLCPGILLNLALSAASLLVCVTLLEVILRFNGYGNLEIYEPDPALYWKLKPNQNCYTKVDHKPVHINSHGTRGPEFEVAKSANTIRILSLGDSKAFGWGLSDAETYSALIERLLQERLGNRKKVEVINAGVNAWSYPQLNAYFRHTGLGYNPDFVIVADANLFTQFSEKSGSEFAKKFMGRVRLKNFLRRFALYHYFIEIKLKEVYNRQRNKFMPVEPAQDTLFKEQQQKDPGLLFRQSIEELSRLALSNGITPLLLYVPVADDSNPTHQQVVREVKSEVSRRLNISLLDLTPEFVGRGKDLYLEGDPVHPNVKGDQIIARRLFETMSNLVAP